jgi:hypothetical protein
MYIKLIESSLVPAATVRLKSNPQPQAHSPHNLREQIDFLALTGAHISKHSPLYRSGLTSQASAPTTLHCTALCQCDTAGREQYQTLRIPVVLLLRQNRRPFFSIIERPNQKSLVNGLLRQCT